MAWFRREHTPLPPNEQESRVPEGLYVKCSSCKESIYRNDLLANLSVCPKCSFHFRIPARERLEMLFDSPWQELDAGLTSSDPLGFRDTKPYAARLKDGKEKTGCFDALITAVAPMGGIPTLIAAMEYGFIGGSMGVVVGEKVTRAIEKAARERMPSSSSPARVARADGGHPVLMQMARSRALARADDASCRSSACPPIPPPGVPASFAMLGTSTSRSPAPSSGSPGPRHRADHPPKCRGLPALRFLSDARDAGHGGGPAASSKKTLVRGLRFLLS